jgi:hypothetical protein
MVFCNFCREISPLRVSKKYLRWCRKSKRFEWYPSIPPLFFGWTISLIQLKIFRSMSKFGIRVMRKSSLQFLHCLGPKKPCYHHFAKFRHKPVSGFTSAHVCSINKTAANRIKAFENPCTILFLGTEKTYESTLTTCR